MLPASHRMRTREDFTRAVRLGRRAGRPLLAVHLLLPEAGPVSSALPPARIGLVVSRAVGGAVVRTRVKRRLRHELRARLERVPDGSRLVVRATPLAATATSAELGADLERALDRALAAGPRTRRSRTEVAR
ncbi:MAG TPA: ribonuclease P protein component [Actinomycetales bacterium]|nr:ribonuclease P protein component [Actinomycetales bacterium]